MSAEGTPADAIVCRYVFDVDTYKTTQVLARRLIPWLRKLLLIGVVLVFVGCGSFSAYQERLHGEPVDFNLLFPPGIGLLLGVYFLFVTLPVRLFCLTWNFRKKSLFNSDVSIILTSKEVAVQQATSRGAIDWSEFKRGYETALGFALILPEKKRTFFWFPKSGFTQPEGVNRCREMFRQKLKTFGPL